MAQVAVGSWCAWQVSILGLGPIWMGDNEDVKHQTVQLLQDGGIFAFDLSEKDHGADLYPSFALQMALKTKTSRRRKRSIGK